MECVLVPRNLQRSKSRSVMMLDGVQSDVLLLTDATNLRLQSIPAQTFAHPFEQRTLDVDVERLEKPALETSWTEHMLVSCLWNLIFRPGDKKKRQLTM